MQAITHHQTFPDLVYRRVYLASYPLGSTLGKEKGLYASHLTSHTLLYGNVEEGKTARAGLHPNTFQNNY